jgi:hypothetical protein
MNEEDKQRFARYRKDYIPSVNDDVIIDIFDKKKKEQLGFVNNITINKDEIINNVLSNKTVSNQNVKSILSKLQNNDDDDNGDNNDNGFHNESNNNQSHNKIKKIITIR